MCNVIKAKKQKDMRIARAQDGSFLLVFATFDRVTSFKSLKCWHQLVRQNLIRKHQFLVSFFKKFINLNRQKTLKMAFT